MGRPDVSRWISLTGAMPVGVLEKYVEKEGSTEFSLSMLTIGGATSPDVSRLSPVSTVGALSEGVRLQASELYIGVEVATFAIDQAWHAFAGAGMWTLNGGFRDPRSFEAAANVTPAGLKEVVFRTDGCVENAESGFCVGLGLGVSRLRLATEGLVLDFAFALPLFLAAAEPKPPFSLPFWQSSQMQLSPHFSPAL